MQVQLLCTFVETTKLFETVDKIKSKYDVVGGSIFVLDNTDDSEQTILTYNVKDMGANDILHSTISVHRKKHTNTIYTINSLNELIKKNNNGILDKKFKVNWEEYKNCIIVVAYGELKIIHTKLREIISL